MGRVLCVVDLESSVLEHSRQAGLSLRQCFVLVPRRGPHDAENFFIDIVIVTASVS